MLADEIVPDFPGFLIVAIVRHFSVDAAAQKGQAGATN
jgi:hypothetical protein